MLMELKDSKFSIGHAYSFVGKCSQYKPELAIVCSTEGVDPDVKEYLKNTGIAAHYVENLEDLSSAFASVFSGQNAKNLMSLLEKVSWDFLLTRSLLSNFDTSLPIPDGRYSVAYRRSVLPVARGRWRRP